LSLGSAERLGKFIFLPRNLCCSQNSKRYRKKFSAALHSLRKAARNISRQNGAKQGASVEFEMHSIAIIAGNRHGFDNPASLRLGARRRGEKREAHGESRKQVKRVVA
jgi:hypothetical protein